MTEALDTIDWNATNYDPERLHDDTTNPERITIKSAGWYLFLANISWGEGFNDQDVIFFFINAYQGGANHYASIEHTISKNTEAPNLSLVHLWPMQLGDYFTVSTSHNYGEARLLAAHVWSGSPTFAAVIKLASGLPTDL
jgi:hypothetical protein